MKKRFASVLPLMLVLTLLIGMQAGYAAETIKIGVLYPLTGGAAAEGRELRAGAELAAEIANTSIPEIKMDMAKRAGIASMGGAKIELIFKDHEGNPTLGADQAKKLIQDDKVIGIMGCYHSAVTKTVSAVCEEMGIPMINDSSTSPALTSRGFKWFWRTTPHDITFTQDLFEFLKGMTEGKAKGVTAVPKNQIKTLAAACEKTEWGSQVSETIGTLSKEYGYDLKKSILYAAKSPDLSSEVRSLKSAKPDIMLFASYASDAILLMKTLKAEKASPKMIWGQDAGFEAPEFRSTLGDDVVGMLTRTVFAPKVGQVKEVAGQVNSLYKQEHGPGSERGFGQSFHRRSDLGRSPGKSRIHRACRHSEGRQRHQYSWRSIDRPLGRHQICRRGQRSGPERAGFRHHRPVPEGQGRQHRYGNRLSLRCGHGQIDLSAQGVLNIWIFWPDLCSAGS